MAMQGLASYHVYTAAPPRISPVSSLAQSLGDRAEAPAPISPRQSQRPMSMATSLFSSLRKAATGAFKTPRNSLGEAISTSCPDPPESRGLNCGASQGCLEYQQEPAMASRHVANPVNAMMRLKVKRRGSGNFPRYSWTHCYSAVRA